MLFASFFSDYTSGQQRGATSNAPSFDQYPVAELYTGPVVVPMFLKGDPDKLPFPDGDLRCSGMDEGERKRFGNRKPNFAGQYIIESCTCGSGCHYLFMWNARTGNVIRKVTGTVEIGPYVQVDPPIVYAGEEYRADSRLLTVEGCFNQDAHPNRRDCAKYYYEFKDGRFVKVHKTLGRVPPPYVELRRSLKRK